MLLYSLLFGFAAWALGAAAIGAKKKTGHLVSGSFLCACVGTVWQFFVLRHRAFAGDYSGILDTVDVTIFGVCVMLAVTVLLCAIALLRRKKHDISC